MKLKEALIILDASANVQEAINQCIDFKGHPKEKVLLPTWLNDIYEWLIPKAKEYLEKSPGLIQKTTKAYNEYSDEEIRLLKEAKQIRENFGSLTLKGLKVLCEKMYYAGSYRVFADDMRNDLAAFSKHNEAFATVYESLRQLKNPNIVFPLEDGTLGVDKDGRRLSRFESRQIIKEKIPPAKSCNKPEQKSCINCSPKTCIKK